MRTIRKLIITAVMLAIIATIGAGIIWYLVGFGPKIVYIYNGQKGEGKVELRDKNIAYVDLEFSTLYEMDEHKIKGMGKWEEVAENSYLIKINGKEYSAWAKDDTMKLEISDLILTLVAYEEAQPD